MTTDILRVDNEIVLRWPSAADADELFGLLAANRAHLGRWLPWVESATVESERRWIEGRLAAKAQGQASPPLIMYQGALVGCAAIERVELVNKLGEIGYWLAEDFQGRGIVTCACRAVLDYAFCSLGMNRVEIRAALGNQKSRAIPERLGFAFEGAHRQALLLHGQFHDMAVYSILASEWMARKV